jgi:hypothetical protein
VLERANRALLDGYGWRPLTAECDWDQVAVRIDLELFSGPPADEPGRRA